MAHNSDIRPSPLVAAIIPTFNRADFLPVTLDSILSQNADNLHIFIMDDGSEDDTELLVKTYQARHANIHYFHHANQGEAFTVNEGVRTAHEKFPELAYFTIINSDDPVLPGFFDSLVCYLDEHPEADIVYPDWYMIDHAGKIIRPHRHKNFSTKWLFESCIYQVGPGAFFRSSAFKNSVLRGNDYRYCGDFYMWLSLSLKHVIRRYPKYLATWRLHAGSLTLKGRSEKKADEFVKMIHDFSDKHQNLAFIRQVYRKFITASYLQAALVCWRGRLPMKSYLSQAFALNPLWSLWLCFYFSCCLIMRRFYILFYRVFPRYI